ncbi:N-6 DNA methylase [Escherichia coli]|uniref:class I SAM-dependent DNA methyltransferase n=1 Tax=Escherichia coli TaxID=562 RepID=UPI000A9C2FA2
MAAVFLIFGDLLSLTFSLSVMRATVTKQAVLDKLPVVEKLDENAADAILRHASGQHFYNTSPLDLSKLGETQPRLNLERYIRSFSYDAREIFEHFKFYEFIQQLDDANLLYKVAKKFAEADLSPSSVSNHDMGLIFEDLIRRFAEGSNETAGEHFTPRDIVRLTTSLVFADDDAALTKPGLIRRIYDPTAGTGGFLSSGMEYLHGINPSASLRAYGQELNPESYAICKADMLIKGQDISNIKLGNTLSDDQLWNERFDYCLSNPPFGVDWKKIDTVIRKEHKKGYDGRFGPGLPRVSDGSLLFLLHLISKMNDNSRIGIILNGSPLFTGGAGSGESEIRRFVLEQDLLDAIVALPTDMFYNTGIATYIWVLSNHKPKERKGKVLLINATEQFAPMRKSLGSKRKELTEAQIDEIVNQYTRYQPSANVKLFKTSDFGYRRITVERPLKLAFYPRDLDRRVALLADKDWSKYGDLELLAALDAMDDKYLSREKFKKALPKVSAAQFKLLIKHLSETDENAEVCKTKGKPEPDASLRDYENVPLSESVETYFTREVLPYIPDAWIDIEKTDPYDGQVGLVGYEIPFNRYFYQYQSPRSLEEIDRDLDEVSREIMVLLAEVHS